MAYDVLSDEKKREIYDRYILLITNYKYHIIYM